MTSRATDVFAGISVRFIGQRLGLNLRVLTERYAENGQVGLLAYWRGDVQVARRPLSPLTVVYRGRCNVAAPIKPPPLRRILSPGYTRPILAAEESSCAAGVIIDDMMFRLKMSQRRTRQRAYWR